MFDYKSIPDGPEDEEIVQYLKRFLDKKEDIVKNKGVMHALEQLEYIAEKEIMTEYCKTDIEEVSDFIIRHLDYNDMARMDLILTITVQMSLAGVWNVIINEKNIADREVSELIRRTANEILEFKYIEFMDKCYKRTVEIANTPEVNMDKHNGKRRQIIINDEMAWMISIVLRLLLVLLVLFDILDIILIISGDQEFNTATIAYLIITLLVLCFILFLKKSVRDTEKAQRFSAKRDTTNISKNHNDPRKKVGVNANKDQNMHSYTEIENQYFGKLVFQKDDTRGIIETTIKEMNFGGTVLNIDICIYENSDMDIMLDKLKSICANASEFMQEVYPQLAEFCNGIDLYDENGRIIDNFNEDLLMEKYRLKWINVDTNSDRENIINISGYICDDVNQEIEIQINCTSNNITYELL